MAMPPLTALVVLLPMAIAVLFLNGLRQRKRRSCYQQKRATLKATASWENEGGRVALPPN